MTAYVAETIKDKPRSFCSLCMGNSSCCNVLQAATAFKPELHMNLQLDLLINKHSGRMNG